MADQAQDDERIPRLVRLYVRQVAIGFGVSAVFVGLLLGLDVAHLRSLMLATEGGMIAAFLLFFFNGLVFAGVQFAMTIMRMGVSDPRPPRGGRRAPITGGQPVALAVSAGHHEGKRDERRARSNRFGR